MAGFGMPSENRQRIRSQIIGLVDRVNQAENFAAERGQQSMIDRKVSELEKPLYEKLRLASKDGKKVSPEELYGSVTDVIGQLGTLGVKGQPGIERVKSAVSFYHTLFPQKTDMSRTPYEDMRDAKTDVERETIAKNNAMLEKPTKPEADKEIDTFTGTDNNRYTKFQKFDGDSKSYKTYYDPPLPPGVRVHESSDDTGARMEKQDIQKQMDAFNQSQSSISRYEKRHGKQLLDEWNGLLEKSHPNAMSVLLDQNIPDSERQQQLMAALSDTQDPTLKSRLQIAANYSSAIAKRDAYKKNLNDRGHDVDENGKLIKLKAKPATSNEEITPDIWSKAVEAYKAKGYDDAEAEEFLLSKGHKKPTGVK